MKEEREADAYEAYAGTGSQIKKKKGAKLVVLNYYYTCSCGTARAPRPVSHQVSEFVLCTMK